MKNARTLATVGVAILIGSLALGAQSKRPSAPVQKVRDGLYRVGAITVDTVKKELSVACFVNSDVTTLEFVANTRGGAKAYESALTIDTDAVTFNTALLLMGLDPAHARVPGKHFDPAAPKGDLLEISIEWKDPGGSHRVPIERLLYDERTRATLAEGPWVYTGSSFVDGKYLADIDGVLIGFVHSPAPVIENPRSGAVNAYGSVVLNKNLPMPRGSAITMTIKSIQAKKSSR